MICLVNTNKIIAWNSTHMNTFSMQQCGLTFLIHIHKIEQLEREGTCFASYFPRVSYLYSAVA